MPKLLHGSAQALLCGGFQKPRGVHVARCLANKSSAEFRSIVASSPRDGRLVITNFTDSIDRLGRAHADRVYIFLSFDGRSSNTPETNARSHCFYVPDHDYRSDFQ